MTTITVRMNPLAGLGGAEPPIYAASHTTWWADDLDLADGAAVSAWSPRHDDLGYGDLAQATASKQPTFDANPAYLNGRPTVVSDGTDDHLDTGAPTASISQPNTIVLIGGFIAVSADDKLYDGVGSERNTLYNSAGNWALYAGSNSTDGATDNNKHLLVAVFNGNSPSLEIDGVSVALSGSVGSQALGDFRLFAESGLVSGHFANAAASLVQVLDGTLTADELVELESFAADHYGLSIA